MNDEHETNAESKATPPPHIPPPDLSRKPTAPESPLDKIKHSATPAPAAPTGEPGVKVKLHSGDSAVDETASVDGLAPFNARVIAVVIDIVLVWGIQLGLVLILPEFMHKLAWLIGLAYFITRDSLPFLGGQSVGKKAMKLRAVTLDGRPLTGNWEPSLIRAGVLCIPFFFLLELYLLLTRETGAERGRRLGDEWAKTKVIVETVPVAGEEDETI
ncbi:MAG: RDD family protein [Verrucomicrobiota bacterium]